MVPPPIRPPPSNDTLLDMAGDTTAAAAAAAAKRTSPLRMTGLHPPVKAPRSPSPLEPSSPFFATPEPSPRKLETDLHNEKEWVRRREDEKEKEHEKEQEKSREKEKEKEKAKEDASQTGHITVEKKTTSYVICCRLAGYTWEGM